MKKNTEEKKYDGQVEQKRPPKVKIDRSDTTLRDKAGVKFWKKYFEGKHIVTNEEFAIPLKQYVSKKKMYADEVEKDKFIQIVLTKFLLLVDPSQYPDKRPSVNFVDKNCVQAAIHVFGPWIQMFEMIKKHFCDPVEEAREPGPLSMWHGRMTEEEAKVLLIKKTETNNDSEGWKSSKKARYLLRYGIDSIILSSIRRGKKRTIRFYHEPLVRRKPYHKHLVNWNKVRTGKKKLVPAQWTYVVSIAAVGCFRDNVFHFTLLVNFLEMMRGQFCDDLEYRAKKSRKIRTPVYAPDMIPVEQKQDVESSDTDSPVEPVPLKCISNDDDETDEETMKNLDAEDSKES